MAYSRAKLNSKGDSASPCLRPQWIGKASEENRPTRTLLQVSLRHILINLTNFLRIPNSVRILCKSYIYIYIYRPIYSTPLKYIVWSPPLVGQAEACAHAMQGARVRSQVGTGFMGEVFRGLSLPVRQMSGNFRPQGPRISFGHHYHHHSSIHYGRQWPEMFTRPKNLNIHIYALFGGAEEDYG